LEKHYLHKGKTMAHERQTSLIIANWKMYKLQAETEAFIAELKPLIAESTAAVWIAVSFTVLTAAKQSATDSAIQIGAQNMNDASEGAFTGEVAAKMLLDVGAQFVLLGHSERRQYFQENNAFINRKIKRALVAGLRPVLCIGETLPERNAGETEDVLATQISECLADIDVEAIDDLVIAYEPVWAIGTGMSATPEMAQETHNFCREYLAQQYGAHHAAHIPLLYGGSVKPENATVLLIQPDIDGLLVGSASLQAASLAAIVNSAPSSLPSSFQEEKPIHNT
jgi:triosephosphate isomerase